MTGILNGNRTRVVAWGVVGSLMAVALVVNTIALIYTVQRLLRIIGDAFDDLTR